MTKPNNVSDVELRAYVEAYNRGAAYLKNVLGLVPDLTRGGFTGPGVVPWVANPMVEYPGLGLEFLDEDGITAEQKWQAVLTTPVRCHDNRNNEIVGTLPFVLIAHRDQTDAHFLSFKRLLADAKIDPNSVDKNGVALLHYCAEYNRPEIAKALIEAGADPSSKSVHRLDATPLELAEYLGHTEVGQVLAASVAQKTVESVIAGVLAKHVPEQATLKVEQAAARMSRETFAYMLELGARDFQSVLYGLVKQGDYASLLEAIDAGVLVEKNAKDRPVILENNVFQVLRGLAGAGAAGLALMPTCLDRMLDAIRNEDRFPALADVFVRQIAFETPPDEFVGALLAYSRQRYPDFLEQPVPGKKTGQVKHTVLGLIVDAKPGEVVRVIGPDYPKVPMASSTLDLYSYADRLSKSPGNADKVRAAIPSNESARQDMGRLALHALESPKVRFDIERSSPNRQSGEMAMNLIACGATLTEEGWRKVAEATMPTSAAYDAVWPFLVHVCTHPAILTAESALKAILDSGAVDINHRWKDGNTLLHYAAGKPSANSVLVLLGAGADPTLANDAGKTPRQLLEEDDSPLSQGSRDAIVPMLEAAAAKRRIDQVLSAANLPRSAP